LDGGAREGCSEACGRATGPARRLVHIQRPAESGCQVTYLTVSTIPTRSIISAYGDIRIPITGLTEERRTSVNEVTVESLARFCETFADLGDADVMRAAWS